MVGGMIMCHGDDAGLRLPATVAPVQVAVICVKDTPEVAQLAERIERELSERRIRVRIDRRTDVGLGRRLTDWELKGVPVRIEIGPRDLAEGNVSLVRRDRRAREPVPTDAAVHAQDGLARRPWERCGPEGEQRLNRAGVSIRCVTRPDGSLPDSLDDVDLMAIAGRAY